MRKSQELPDVLHPSIESGRFETPDQVLIQRIAGGDKRALEVLFRRYKTRIFRFVLRLSDDHTVAEEVVISVLLDVWRQAADFAGRSSVSTWLLAIARNKAMSAMRRKAEQPLDQGYAIGITDQAPGPEQLLQELDRRRFIRACLRKLSPAHREIIDLVYYHDKSVNEVAEIIAIPVATVKTRMHYARRQLKELISAMGIHDPMAV
jgi:RNA polymerase sigma-70 factor (ECF subfamily)